jgi:hypothetical protein
MHSFLKETLKYSHNYIYFQNMFSLRILNGKRILFILLKLERFKIKDLSNYEFIINSMF